MPLKMRSSVPFLYAEIQEVVVPSVSRVWEFPLCFAEVLPIALFNNCASLGADEFSKTEPGDLYHPRGNQIFFSPRFIVAYYRVRSLRRTLC